MSLMPNAIIGVLSWDYLQPKGGMGRSLQWIVQALRRDGLSVRAVAPCVDHQCDISFLSWTRRYGGHVLFSFLLPFALARHIRRAGITQMLCPIGPGGIFWFCHPPVPTIAIVYHSYWQQAALVPGQRWKKLFCLLERRSLSFCSDIFCFSIDTKHALVDAYGLDPTHIIVLPHAVSFPEHRFPAKQSMLCVCVARLEARKGVEVLLRAWPTIVQHVPHARLIVVGDGVLQHSIDRCIRATVGAERRSHVSQETLHALLQEAQIAFFPAYLEGFGLACAEAMIAGCAVIASDVDGLRRFIQQGENGMLVAAGDTHALAAAAIHLLQHPHVAQQMGERAMKHIRTVVNPLDADRAVCHAVRSLFA